MSATLLVVVLLALPGVAGAREDDPTVHGRYGVGFTQITVDTTSVTTGEPRSLDTWIWYPIDPLLSPPNGAPVVDAPVRRKRWPLLLFSHGSCSYPGQSAFLMETLASWGVIVAAPLHPDSSIFDPDGCLTGGNSSYANRVPDMQVVLTRLLELAADPTSRLARRIRPTRIGVSGHSFGGQTALRAVAADPRFVAALALAPARQDGLAIAQPLMVMGGTLDSITPFTANAIPSFNEGTGVRFMVRITDTGHCAFIPLCVEPACGDGCAPDGIAQDVANHDVLRYAVPFVLRYVAGKRRDGRLLDPASAPPEVTVVTNVAY